MRIFGLLAALMGCARFAAAGTVWIDTDVSIGSPIREVDDAYALVLAFHSPEIRIAGLSTSYGNASLRQTTGVARDLVRRFGGNLKTTDVFAGAISANALGRRTEASEALAAALRKKKLTYVALGPLTNLATFVRIHPDLARRIERVIFVGGHAVGSIVAFGPSQTFRIHDANVFKDPAAAALVLRSRIPITLVPVAAGGKIQLTQSDLRALKQRGGATEYLARRSTVWLWFWTHVVKEKGGPIFDALAVAVVTTPTRVLLEQRAAEMDGAGNLVVSAHGRRVQFCTGFKRDLQSWVLRRLTAQ